MSEPAHEPAQALQELLALMATLRDPERGCPWDREQTGSSLAPYAIEEAYELADAIAREDADAIRDELGDLLFQVVFHARLGEEQGRFNFAAIARGLADKLVRRHPHVFEDQARERSAGDWEAHKARERAAIGMHGTLAGVAQSLPALSRAAKLGRRAARVGFDWDGPQAVRSKVAEELAELDAALEDAPELAAASAAVRSAARSSVPAAVREEIGDLLFTIANWARHLHVDPEAALRDATRKFERRFEHVEQAAAAGGQRLESLSAGEWDALWEAAKAALVDDPGIQAGFTADP